MKAKYGDNFERDLIPLTQDFVRGATQFLVSCGILKVPLGFGLPWWRHLRI